MGHYVHIVLSTETELAHLERDINVKYVVMQGWSLRDIDSLPVGVALPLREALHRCREHPPPGAHHLLLLIASDTILTGYQL